MGSEWPTVQLGDLAVLTKGVSYQGAFLDKPGPLLLGLGTIIPGGGCKLDGVRTYGGPIKERQRAGPGDLYLALTDLTQEGIVLGSPALVPATATDAVVTHHVAKLQVTRRDLLDQQYLYYLLQSRDARLHMRAVSTGTTVRSVALSDAALLEFPLPPLDEQQRIAAVLGALDDKIELNRRMSRTLDEMAQAIFQAWFVDATGDGLPQGWRMGRVGDLCELVYGATLREHERKGGPFPVYGSNGIVGWHDEPLIRGPGIVVGRKGTAGAVTWAEGDFFPIDTTFYVRVDDAALLQYLYFALRGLCLSEHGTDSAVPGLNRNVAHGLSVLIPPKELIRRFAFMTRPLQRRQLVAKRESATLVELRDDLLPRLMSGFLYTDV